MHRLAAGDIMDYLTYEDLPYDYKKEQDFARKGDVSMENNTVPIGPTSWAGWITAGAAFAGAVVTYLTGAHDAQSVTAMELTGIGLVSGGLTQVGRYFQAHKSIVGNDITEVIHHELTPGNVDTAVKYAEGAIHNPAGAAQSVLADVPKLVSDVEEFKSSPRPESSVKPDAPAEGNESPPNPVTN